MRSASGRFRTAAVYGHMFCPMTSLSTQRSVAMRAADDAAADAFSDMCEGEPPVTMAEQYQRAAEEKRRLS